MCLKTYFYLFVVTICLASGQMEKTSLTFVIDDTSSMQRDIDHVKYGVNLIFDAVKNSKESPIEDFILITFNDKPQDVRFLTSTKDREIFRSNLTKIRAHGGGDCPESSLSGIKLGLEKSRDGSYIFVFTDDVPDDHWLLDEVQNLAIKKNIQIFFILSVASCGANNKPEYQNYFKIAHATSGEVFRLDKKEIGKILNFVSNTIKARQTEIINRILPPGYGHSVKFPIDSALSNTTLTAIGTNPMINDVTGPDGSKVNSTAIVDLPSVTSLVIPNPKPGGYEAKVGSESKTRFVGTAANKINFKYSFSPVEPTFMSDTVTLPIAGEKSHICVQIFSEDTFIPSQIILTNDDGKVIEKLSLKVLNAKEGIYITKKVMPPDGLFKIGVFGYHEKSKSNIVRESRTYVEVQKNSEPIKDMSPMMVINKGYEVKVKYNETVKLVCNVEAHPKPSITWKDEDGIIYPTEVLTFKLPYSFIAELKIEKVNKTKTYKCLATNAKGDVSRNIEVQTEKPKYLDVLEEPKDANIVYKNSNKIYCKINAWPPAVVTWHKNGAVLKTDEFMELSDRGDMLTIKKMMPHLVGSYFCSATNGLQSRQLGFKLSITGTEPRTSMLGPSKVIAEYNKPLFLRCQVIGYPKPKIVWTNQETGKEIRSVPVVVSNLYDYGEEMQIEKVTKNATYKCTAKNDIGEHSSAVMVHTIHKVHFDIIETPKNTTIKYKENGQVFCKIDAYPSVIIQWKFKGKEIKNNHHYDISSDGSSLKIKDMQPALRGFYLCRVDHKKTNTLKTFIFKVTIRGTVKPQIDKTENEIKVKEGSTVDINCRIIKGTPPPTLTWAFKSDNDNEFRTMEASSSNIHIERVTSYDSGVYRCLAINAAGEKDDHVVYLTVEFAPTIEKAITRVDSKKGDKTKLPCLVRGYPQPTVVWTFNGTNILADKEYQIFRDNSIRFSASHKNCGKFTCTATNEHGTAELEMQVDYYEEVQILAPDATSINTYVGEREKLLCEASGYPEPTITWWFLSSEDPSKTPKVINGTGKSPDKLVVKLTSTHQDGEYICSASNMKSEKKLTFTVKVQEPAHIIPNDASRKPTKAVIGDLVRIPCHAVGKPKPYVTWMKNGYNIPTGHDYYSLDIDGALLIEGITEGGSFTCVASNDLSGPDYMPFEVELTEHIQPTEKYDTNSLKFGKTAEVKCPIPHTAVDLLRWFKNTVLKVTGELMFDRVTNSDAGVYTCRVTHRISIKSESKSVHITVLP